MAPSATSNKRGTAVVNETLVRGTTRLEDLQRLVFLIHALCPEFGSEGKFLEHDRVYTPSPEARAPKNSIRLRKHLHNGAASVRPPGLDYVLLTYGIPDRRVPPPCERRPMTSVFVGREAPDLLAALGCVMKYECVRSGMRFRARAGFVIDVYVVKKLRQAGNPASATGLQDKDEHAIVDVVSDAAVPPEQLLAFMQHLEPIVVLTSGRR